MSKTAVITGSGSGVGRAVAVLLNGKGWNIGLVGRRQSALEETLGLLDQNKGDGLVCSCDITDCEAVRSMSEKILDHYGAVQVLVNSAGFNVPKRSLKVLQNQDYHRILDTNMNGAFYCVQAFLPFMRFAGEGTIVNVISDAGKFANAKAGVGYVVSKFGLSGLTQSINLEESENGIRATAVFPGDIDTPFLKQRPTPPTEEARERMMRPEDVAECVLLAIHLPKRAVIEEILVRPPC